MIVEKVIKLKNGKYKLIINGEEIITYDNVILENGILYNKNINNDVYLNIKESTNYYNIYDKVLKFIIKKRRSEKEVIEYLGKHNVKKEHINRIMIKLKSINLINDLEYAKAFINDNICLSKKGINKIKSELQAQNIPFTIIESQLNNVDVELFNARLEKMIIKKIKSNKKYSNYQLKQKILMDMLNLGYNKDKIIEIINNNLDSELNVVEKEFNKIYNNLIKKYSEKDVFIKIKQKLLYRGFNNEDINNLIQKKQN